MEAQLLNQQRTQALQIPLKEEFEERAMLAQDLRTFLGGLPYDRARVIERTQEAFKGMVRNAYEVGKGLILIHDNEPERYAAIVEEHFPGLGLSSAEKYMRFARGASKFSILKQFNDIRGGYSKALTVLHACTEAEIMELEETGGLRDFTLDEISRMSVRQLQKALRMAKHKAAKAQENLAAENAELKGEIKALKAADEELAQVEDMLSRADRKIAEACRILRKISNNLLARDRYIRKAAISRYSTMEYYIQTLRDQVIALERKEQFDED